MLEIKNLVKSYSKADSKIEILKGISFSLASAESLAIIGRSGSGKSTLLSILSGLESFDSGEINFDGHHYQKMTEKEFNNLRKNKVSTIFQHFHLLAHLNVLENVMLGLEIKGDENIEEKSLDFLRRVGLEKRVDHYPHQLSGGEKQRTAIARSLITDPQLLLADEPTGNLDDSTANQVFALMMELVKEHGTSLVLVTHDQKLASQCQRTLALKDGLLVDKKC